MKNLQGKVVVITGAGSGLGRELARVCAGRGMKLVLADVDEPGMAQTLAEIREAVPEVAAVSMRVDVSKLDEVQALATLARESFDAAHVVFNNAGVSAGGPLWEATEADWQWVTGVNVYGVAWGIQSFVPMMLTQGEGHVVNTASAAGWVNAPGGGIYNASKHAVVAISETLAFDLRMAEANVGVTVLCPAFFPTAIVDAERNRPPELADTAPMSEARKFHQEMVRHAVMHGRISAEEIAEMTVAAVEHDQFYVFPHKKIKQLIKARAEAADQEQEPFDTMAGAKS